MKSKNAAPGEWPGRRLDDELFEAICLGGAGFNKKLGEKVIWLMLRQYAQAVGLPSIAPHDARRTCAKLCRAAGGQLEQIQLLLGHASVQTTERYLGPKQDLVHPPNDGIKLTLATKQATNNDSRPASLKR